MLELVQEVERQKQLRKILKHDLLSLQTPNPTQWEYLNSHYRELAICGANQIAGKSWTQMILCAMTTTGEYFDNYTGIKWDRPILCAIGGVDARETRNVITDRLFGKPIVQGGKIIGREPGLIPSEYMPDGEGNIQYARNASVAHQIDYVHVKHKTNGEFDDGWSKILVYSYSGDWDKLQGLPIDLVLGDEECAPHILGELRARLGHTRGYLRFTFSPRNGRSKFYCHFADNRSKQVSMIKYTVVQCTHQPPEVIEQEIERWGDDPEAMARLWAEPVTGEGMVLPYADERMVVDDHPITSDWLRIIGIDLPHTVTGWFALCEMAFHRSKGAIVTGVWKDKGHTDDRYIQELFDRGGHVIPVAWPHDGGRMREPGSPIAKVYRDAGLNFLKHYARYKTLDGKWSHRKLPIVRQIQQAIKGGTFKVFRSCKPWFDEKALWGYEEGGVIKPSNQIHIMDAMIKAWMSQGHAKPVDLTTGRQATFGYGRKKKRHVSVRNRRWDFYTPARKVI